jgi:putative transposase
VWATDITYIPMAKGFMYLTAIIDLHTRFVLNWSVSNTMSADWCADILQETIQKYGVPEIFNTDQRSQYTSEVHTNVLLNNGIKFLWTGRKTIDNILLKDYGGQSNTRMYIYKHILTESAFTEDLKIILNFIIRRLHQSLDYGTPIIIITKVA